MTAYSVDVSWEQESSWWVAVVYASGREWATQARRLDGIRDAVVEVIELMTGERPSELSLRILGFEDAEDLRERRNRIEEETAQLATDTARIVRRARRAGLGLRDAGQLLGISHQRVQQLERA